MTNIVYIIADDLGRHDAGFSGSTDIPTPNIDALAAESCILTRHHTSPVCTASRIALHSGTYAHVDGLADEVIRPWRTDISLGLTRATLAEKLKAAGYYTAMAGKHHLGHGTMAMHPNNRGFDWFRGALLGSGDYFTQERLGERDWWHNTTPTDESGNYTTDIIGDHAEALVLAHDFSTPLFLNVNFTAPHLPLQALQSDIDALSGGSLSGDRLTYAAMIRALDRNVAKVTDAIKARSQWTNTLFFFGTDNGGEEANAPGNNGTFRGEKGQLYNGGVIGPAMIRWPGHIAAGTSNALTHIIDLHKTALLAAGDMVTQSKGADIRPLIAGTRQRRFMLIHCDYEAQSIAYRTGPSSSFSSAAQEAYYGLTNKKVIVNPTRIYEGSIPTTIEVYANDDDAEATDLAGGLDMTATQALIRDIRAQCTTPKARRTDENQTSTYTPQAFWEPT